MITTKCIGLVAVLKNYTVTSVRINFALELTTTTTTTTLPHPPPGDKGRKQYKLVMTEGSKSYVP